MGWWMIADIHEHDEHSDMHIRVIPRVKDCQQDQPRGANDGEYDREDAQDFLAGRVVVRQAPLVS